MSDQVQTPTAPPVANPPVTPQSDNTDKSIPYERFKEVNDQKKAAEEKLRAFEEKEKKQAEDQKKAEEDKLKKDGEYKTLLTTREQEIEKLRQEATVLKEKADKADLTEKTLRDQTLAKITDQDLRNVAGKLPTPELLIFIDKLNTGTVLPANGKGQLGQGTKSLSEFKSPEEYKVYLRSIGHL